jgi:UDP-N-acetylglucosamine--N-acetylmuramyl-(pentapeptide) pyrophosphoryl-undecaprenol N-acetylglucosamine transferase
MDRRIVALAAGGTGGHLFPAQALAAELKRRGSQIVLLTDQRGAAFADESLRPHLAILPASGLGAGFLSKVRAAGVIGVAAARARSVLASSGAQAVVGFGGYPSFAPALAAKTLRLPLILHEQGTKFSLANLRLLPLADQVALSFPFHHPGARGRKVSVTGPPVRDAIQRAARAPYPSTDGPLRLLVVGGSQGAAVFGRTIPRALLSLDAKVRGRIHLALQYAGEDAASIERNLREAGVQVAIKPFFHDMADQLVRANLVICRAGASTAADLTAIGRPAIFVPIPRGGSADEQRRNAEAFQRAGAGWHLSQVGLERGELSGLLASLFGGEALHPAAEASARLGQPEAAARLADLVEETVLGRFREPS